MTLPKTGNLVALVPVSIIIMLFLYAWLRFLIRIIELSVSTSRKEEDRRRKRRRSLIAFTGVSVLIVFLLGFSLALFVG